MQKFKLQEISRKIVVEIAFNSDLFIQSRYHSQLNEIRIRHYKDHFILICLLFG